MKPASSAVGGGGGGRGAYVRTAASNGESAVEISKAIAAQRIADEKARLNGTYKKVKRGANKKGNQAELPNLGVASGGTGTQPQLQ